MNKIRIKEPTDYTAHKWDIAEAVDGYDLKATFYPCEECYLCYREYKDNAEIMKLSGLNGHLSILSAQVNTLSCVCRINPNNPLIYK